MKKLLSVFLLILILCLNFPTQVLAAPSFYVSASSSTVAPGGTFTATITGSECVGRVNITVSNGSSSHSEVWVEDNSASITVTA